MRFVRTRVALGRRSPWRFALGVAGVVCALALASTLGFRLLDAPAFEYDLLPFYCGGAAVAAGRDPYLAEPLRTCEHANSAAVDNGRAYVVPDPLPAYDQAFFAAASRVDFLWLRRIWYALEIAAFAATVVLLARVTGAGALVVASALVLADFWCSSLLGQLVPFSVLGLVLVAWGLGAASVATADPAAGASLRAFAVGAGIVLAMVEPHLGLPAALAVALWGGRFRIPAIAGLAFLAVVSLLAVPLSVVLEYVTRVAPAHVLSEVNNQDQYGTAYAFHRLGASEHLATTLASVTYGVFLVVAMVVARGVARVYGGAMLPLAATAFVLVGTPFLHLPQLAAALPAALLLAARSRSRGAGAIVALLSVPWLDFSNVLKVLPVAGGATFALLRRLVRLDVRGSYILVGIAMCAIVGATYEATLHATGEVIRLRALLPGDLPETSWKTIVDAQQHRYVRLADLAKVPTLVALVALVASLARASLASPPRSAAPRKS